MAAEQESETFALTSTLSSECWFNGNYQQEKSIPGLPTLLKSTGKYVYDCQRGVIWLQTEPLLDGFLFSLSGDNRQILSDGQLLPLSAKYQKAIGRLMLVLLSGDQAQIEQYFSITQANSDPVGYELIPKRGRLKKAVQSVFVMPSAGASDNLKHLEINIVDRSGQITRLTSQARYRYAEAESLASSCGAFLGEIAAQSCSYFKLMTPVEPL